MSESTQPAQPILAEAEADRRMLLLAELQAALTARQVRSVLARHHRLVLRYNGARPPSGLTDPKLYIHGPGGTVIATTDGTIYHLASGIEHAVTDPAAAAAAISGPASARDPQPDPHGQPA